MKKQTHPFTVLHSDRRYKLMQERFRMDIKRKLFYHEDNQTLE